MTEALDELTVTVAAVPWAARTLPLPSPAVDAKLYPRASVLTGITCRETSGVNAAVVNVYNGQDANGELVASLGIDKFETRVLYPMVACPLGVYLGVVSGTVTGAVWVVDLPVQ